MAPQEREVAGLRCSQVLEVLSDYLDEDLDANRRAQVEEHLRGCDWCAQFGTTVGETVRVLRVQLGAEEQLPADVAARLRDQLESA
jgi:predicted anti-sigma-YlaC factor YlaD